MLHTDTRLPLPDRLIYLLTGLSDGLIIPLVIATSMQAAGWSANLIMGWGIGLTIISALIFLLVSYVTVRDAISEHHHDEEMLVRLGISHNEGETFSEEVTQEDEAWTKLNMHGTLEANKPHRPVIAALSGGGYFLGGLLVVTPYLFFASTDYGKIASVLAALIALLTVGATKAGLTGQSLTKGAIRLATLGMLAAAAAHYIVSLLFK